MLKCVNNRLSQKEPIISDKTKYSPTISLDQIEKYFPILNTDIQACYEFITSNGIIICLNNQIYIMNPKLLKYEKIEWEILKTGFENNLISVDVMKGVGGLRKMTIACLLKNIDIVRSCYIENGSTHPTSDLDFTYTTYIEPYTVVEKMVRFYNMFYEIYGNYPYKTFDTNFYITSCYIHHDCYNKITNQHIKNLFIPDGNQHRLFNFSDPSLAEQSLDVCYYVQTMRLSKTMEYSTDKLIQLIKLAKLFHHILQTQKYDLNDTRMKDTTLFVLRTLYYLMALFSNESYISDSAFGLIVLNKNNFMYDKEKYLSFVDNYIYIKNWYELYINTNNYMAFYDIVSKYISRCYMSLENTKYNKSIDKQHALDALDWKQNIRGQFSLGNKTSLDKWNMIYRNLEKLGLTSSKLMYEYYTNIYGQIRQNFSVLLNISQTVNTVIEHANKKYNVQIKNNEIILE